MEDKRKIKNFHDLIAWQKAHQLTLLIYRLTKDFPQSEQFGLTNQMRRATVSIGSNIAEGFGRGTSKDKVHFFLMSQGSLFELESQIYVAHDLGYAEDVAKVLELMSEVSRLLSALMKSAPDRLIRDS